MKRQITWNEDMLFYKRIVEDAGILAWITDHGGETVYLSPAWYEFTGAKVGSGEGIGWIQHIHPADTYKVRKNFFDSNDTGAEYGISYRLQTSGGGYQLVWGHGVPRRCGDRFEGYFGMTQTMTEFENRVAGLDLATLAAGVRPLSRREEEVMTLAAEGLSNEEIAGLVNLKERTIEDHLARAIAKLNAKNKAHAVAKAIRLKVV